MKIIAVIPARGGSKGIPRKNIKNFGGRPLIASVIDTALKVDEIERVLVSTEDKEISEVAKNAGAEVPFLRPKELAGDQTPTLPVLIHAVKYLEEEEAYHPDLIILLYATSPLLKPRRISDAIKLQKDGNFDSVVSVVEDKGQFWMKQDEKIVQLYPKTRLNRQLIRPLLRENGALYLCKRDLLIKQKQIVGGRIGFLIMPKYESIDIDEALDFELAEFLYRRRR